MKKVGYLILLFILSINVVYAFDIDMDKIDINGKNDIIINKNLNNVYKIDVDNFNNNSNVSDDIKDITKELVKISLSDNKDNKLKELTKYLYYGSGSSTLTGNLFLTDFVDKINESNYEYEDIRNIRSVDFSEGILIFAYLNDIKIDDKVSDLVLTYWLIDTEDGYRLHFATFSKEEDLEDYFNTLSKNEDNDVVLNNVNKSFGMSKKEVDEDVLNNLYQNNKLSNVYITSLNNNGIDSYGSGFYLRSGVVVTSWSVFLNYLNSSNFIYVNDCNGNTYKVDGVIAANTKYDVVILKLAKDEGSPVSLGDSKLLKYNDDIFMINSLLNNGFSIKNGTFIGEESGKLKNMFAINESSIGSAIYNINGDVIGFATGESLNNDLSYGNSTNYLISLRDMLSNTSYSNIKCYSLDDIKKNYYLKLNDEIEFNNIKEDIWKRYKDIGGLEENIILPLVKASYKDNIISLRYKNNINDTIGTMYLISNFEDKLIDQGYEISYEDSNKKIYKNNTYKVIIKSNLNYLIILIMES